MSTNLCDDSLPIPIPFCSCFFSIHYKNINNKIEITLLHRVRIIVLIVIVLRVVISMSYRNNSEIILICSTTNSGLRRNVIFFVVEKWTQYGLAGYFTKTASDIEWTKIHSHPKKAIFGNSRNNKSCESWRQTELTPNRKTMKKHVTSKLICSRKSEAAGV